MESTAPHPPFLDPHEIARNCAEAQIGDAATQALMGLAKRITADPAVSALVAAAHHCVYATRGNYTAATQQADDAVGDDANLLHSLLLLDSIRLVREKQSQRGVPIAISQAVNQRHAIAWLHDAIAKHGHVGMANWEPGWFRTVGGGELYRLGRLEFVPEAWELPLRVYSNIQTHEVVILAEAGQQFNDQGYNDGSATWTATISEDDDAVAGSPISPMGYAIQQQVRLPAAEWRVVLKQGDPVLDLHVPVEGALTLDALRDAMDQAEAFFDHYYPQRPFVAYQCYSWLFGPQLEAMLPPSSNILRWQREGYLLPGDEDSASFLTFVFGSQTIDLATAPQDTQLRRAIIAHLSAHGRLYTGVWLLLRRDLPRFGTEPYRQSSTQAIRRVAAGSAAGD